eukprot:5242586-Pyramimonas_sp.AAC.1
MRGPKESHKEGRGTPTTHATKSWNDSHICSARRRELSHYPWRTCMSSSASRHNAAATRAGPMGQG